MHGNVFCRKKSVRIGTYFVFGGFLKARSSEGCGLVTHTTASSRRTFWRTGQACGGTFGRALIPPFVVGQLDHNIQKSTHSQKVLKVVERHTRMTLPVFFWAC